MSHSYKQASHLLLLLIVFFPTVLFSQSINANWGQSSINYPTFIQTDPSGNIFRTSFEDSLLVKMNSDGTVLWSVPFPSQPNDSAAVIQGLAIDADGNAYVAGSYSTTHITLGSTLLSADTSKGHSSLFLAKYDADGHSLWAITTAKNSTAVIKAIQVNSDGDIFLSGDIDTVSATFGTTTLQSGVFHVKIDSDHNVVWAKEIHADGQIFTCTMTVDQYGHSTVAGNFNGATCSIATTSLTNSNSATTDIFVLQFNASGNITLAFLDGTATDNDWATDMETGVDGNIYLTGTHETNGLFIKGYNIYGNFLWENNYYRSTSTYTSSELHADQQENLYLTGFFNGPEMDIDTVSLVHSGSSNVMFVASFTMYGHLRWAGMADNCIGEHMVANATGKVYLTGNMNGATLPLGDVTLSNRNTPNGNSGFLAQLDASNPTSLITTGIFNSAAQQKQALAYPNPTSGKIQLSGLTAGQWNLTINSMAGKSIYTSEFNASQVDVDLSSYPKGFYFYELQSDTEEMFIGKIIVE